MFYKNVDPVFRISARAKRLRITVKSSGECVVTIPKRMPMALVDRFVAEKSVWIAQKQNDMRQRNVETLFMASLAVRPYAEAKDEALRFVRERVSTLNAQYGFSFARISVRNQKTRWGSCSRRGNLNFTYRILYLPPHLADYIMVHELCHLAEMNHGPKFWNLVARVCPEYRKMRRELRAYQGSC